MPKWESNLPISFERFTKEDNASIVTFLSQDKSKENEKLQQRIKGIEKQLRDYKGDQVPKVMVMDDNKKRETHILQRGEYLKKGDPVSFNTPSFLPKMSDDLPKNRLGLAKWLVSRENPLTSRVQVNRMWQRFSEPVWSRHRKIWAYKVNIPCIWICSTGWPSSFRTLGGARRKCTGSLSPVPHTANPVI